MTTSLEERNRAGPIQHKDNNDELNGNEGHNRRHGKAISSSSHDALDIPCDTQTVESCPKNTSR